MLADDVKLDLVNRLRLSGRTEVGAYFTNYGRVHNWRFVPGFVEGQPAILVSDPNDRPSVQVFHSADLGRRRPRRHQGFPVCELCHGRGRIATLN